jgi:hypothetical protein
MRLPRGAGWGRAQPSGVPESASQLRRGNSVSQPGSCGNWLADRRSSSSRCASARPGGRSCSRLPASISFCRAGRRPSSGGKPVMALSVRISQRSAGGRAAPGTSEMRQALKPTTCSAAQSPSTPDRRVKGLSEQKITLSRCRRGRSCGRLSSWLPERLSTSNVSARSNTSGGRVRSPQDRSRRRVPASAPLRSCSRVCMRGDR